MRFFLLLACFAPAIGFALDNDYVRVTRDAASCASARVIEFKPKQRHPR
ncbi:MAG TPA: hypothetical protein VFB20_16770 [Burkholderiales bacterium]|nr:hypothetical protein [Burkholderiales bacterium]